MSATPAPLISRWRPGRAFRAWLRVLALSLAATAFVRAEEKAFDLFPMGKPWVDVRIPRYDEHDVLTSMMHTEALTRQDEKRLKLDGLTLVMFQSSGEISIRLKTKQGFYDVAASMLQTHSTTFIEHAQFEMTGDRMTFDTSKQQGTLQGNVEMRIFGVPMATEPAAPAAPRTPPASPSPAQPAPQAQPPAPAPAAPPAPLQERVKAESSEGDMEVAQNSPPARPASKFPKP